MSLSLHRTLYALLPALLLVGLAVAAIWGENGLVARAALQQQLSAEKEALAKLDRENARLLREIRMLGEDALLVERAAAEEIGWARSGATLYRFDDAD